MLQKELYLKYYMLDAVVVNRDGKMEETVNNIEAIISAEKSKVSRLSM